MVDFTVYANIDASEVASNFCDSGEAEDFVSLMAAVGEKLRSPRVSEPLADSLDGFVFDEEARKSIDALIDFLKGMVDNNGAA